MSIAQNFEYYKKSFLKHDFKAGLTVFLVALPLCLGIALASGAPLMSGLIAGIIGGTVISILSGSEISVSGPAAGLAVIVADSIQKLGSFDGFLVAVLLAGVMQYLMGILKWGRLSSYFPESVIKGMLVAIGLVIILKQIPHALGDDGDYEGEFEFFQIADHENTLSELIKSFLNLNQGAVIISVICLIVLIVWDKFATKGYRLLKAIPAALVVVIAGVLINEAYLIFQPELYLGNSPIHMVDIPVLDTKKGLSSVFTFPDFTFISNYKVYTVAITLAIVASLETLLNIEASDSIDPLKRISSPNQELKAQGVGNMLSGLLGGLPVTSVVIRTSANVYSGGLSRMSSLSHGVLLLICTFTIPLILNKIPLSCLAAILLTIGYKLAHPKNFKKIFNAGFDQFIPFIATVIIVIFTDLLIGIIVGTVIGLCFVVYSNFQSVIRVGREGNNLLIKFNKDVSFLNKPQLKEVLQSVQDNDYVFIDGSKIDFIDHDIFNILKDFKQSAKFKNIKVEIKGITRRKYSLRNPKKSSNSIEQAEVL